MLGRRTVAAVAILVVLVAGAGGGFWALRGRSSAQTPPFSVLHGKWQRPDGGYVLEIEDTAADGRMQAAYFNPRAIHVSRAQASRDGGTLRVFVELRDANYPGATYTLTYAPQPEQLVGLYHQPLVGRTFEVCFQRLMPVK